MIVQQRRYYQKTPRVLLVRVKKEQNRNVGVEQNTKPQRLCFTGATKVFKAEHSKTFRVVEFIMLTYLLFI